MGYVRDDKTGKFSWVEGSLPDEEDRFGAHAKRAGAPPGLSSNTMLLGALVLGAVLLLGVWGMRSFKDPGVSIRRIHNHPAEFDGHPVTLRGRVGSVFQVGGNYAYYLLQGRDTIVVFTRGARPAASPNAEVHGSVSIGYLDGVARPALFATN